MIYQDRAYQVEAEASVFDYFGRASGNPLIAMPTGTGKSIVIARLLQRLFGKWPWVRVIISTHVKELIQQNYDKFIDAWPTAPAGIYSSGLQQRDIIQPIIFGGIQSMINNVESFGFRDLLIIDEAHLVNSEAGSRYADFIKHLTRTNPNLRVIGLSATPYRMGQGMLTEGGIFSDVCFDLTSLHAFNRLIDEGYILPLIPKATTTELNVTDVKIQNGDFVQKDLQHAVDKDSITYAACKEIMEQGFNRQSWLVFASGIKHSDHIATTFQSFGIEAVSVHSKMDSDDRDRALKAFKSGKLRCIVNNNVLTTGFDHPALDLIGMLRPTVSTVLWVQMLGRGTRPDYMPGFDLNTTDGRLRSIAASSKQNCLCLDFAGNTKRLGPINDPVLPRKKGQREGSAPIKLCDNCGAYNHTSARFCIGCGAEFQIAVKITMKASTAELIRRIEPVVDQFDVSRVIYSRHQKAGTAPMIKVSYFVNNGLRKFDEYVCLEHGGFAARKARDWWTLSLPGSIPPATTDLALQGIEQRLRVPRAIRVVTNQKYPEIISRIF